MSDKRLRELERDPERAEELAHELRRRGQPEKRPPEWVRRSEKRLTPVEGVPRACKRCLTLAWEDKIRPETVMPLPRTAPPLAEDGSGPCCHDCQAADTLGRMHLSGMPFSARRVVVANERQRSLRLPEGLRKHFGMVAAGIVRASEGADAFERHIAWLEKVGIFNGGGDGP